MAKNILLIFAIVVAIAAKAYSYSASQNIFFDWTFDSGSAYDWNGDGHRYDYASYIDFYDGALPDGAFGGTWLGSGGSLESSLHWSHLLPDLSTPGSNVTSAKLFIDGAWIDGRNDLVSIEGTWTWDSVSDAFLDNTMYNLITVDDPIRWTDGSLDVSVFAGERNFRIDRAILMLDYEESVGSSSAEVPEPVSLVLFGLGMVGLGSVMGRRQ